MKRQVSSLLLSNPVSCSDRCCFCFGIWLLLCSGPPHPDILTSLHFLFLFPSLPLFPVLHRLLLLLSLSLCEWVCVLVTTSLHPAHFCVRMGPLSCACAFPSVGNLMPAVALLYSHKLCGDVRRGAGELSKLKWNHKKLLLKKCLGTNIKKKRLAYDCWSEKTNLAAPAWQCRAGWDIFFATFCFTTANTAQTNSTLKNGNKMGEMKITSRWGS